MPVKPVQQLRGTISGTLTLPYAGYVYEGFHNNHVKHKPGDNFEASVSVYHGALNPGGSNEGRGGGGGGGGGGCSSPSPVSICNISSSAASM